VAPFDGAWSASRNSRNGLWLGRRFAAALPLLMDSSPTGRGAHIKGGDSRLSGPLMWVPASCMEGREGGARPFLFPMQCSKGGWRPVA
jgi:hypothetical protein